MESVRILVLEATWENSSSSSTLREWHSTWAQCLVSWVEFGFCLTSLVPCGQRCRQCSKEFLGSWNLSTGENLKIYLAWAFLFLMSKMNLREVECLTRTSSLLSTVDTSRLLGFAVHHASEGDVQPFCKRFWVCYLQSQEIFVLKFFRWWPTFTHSCVCFRDKLHSVLNCPLWPFSWLPNDSERTSSYHWLLKNSPLL